MIYTIGDLHGCVAKFKHLLEREGITQNHLWAAESSHLVLLGDSIDRGEDGIGVIEHIMQLELEAKQVGGKVTALLGNHDVILLEAFYFSTQKVKRLTKYGQDITFLEMWKKNAGGRLPDLERLEPKHIAWLQQRPAMLVEQQTLFMHADSTFYLEYGKSVQDINSTIQQILEDHQIGAVDLLEERFCRRKEFLHDSRLALSFAEHFGVKRIVHGHTQISGLLNLEPTEVLEPFVYADGVCINLDHGLCYGGDGFVWRWS
ncbi:MAG: metallophosphoesterase [Deinococcales bacterium]